jgi:hypothetical protein
MINNCSFFFFNFYKNYNISKFYFNIEANLFIFNKKINKYLFYLNIYFCLYYYTSFNIINYFNQITNNRIDIIFFKNLQFVYTGKIYNNIITNFKFLLDYIDNNNYSIYISFKKYIVQTNRFLNYKLNKKIYTYQKKNININVETNINLSNNININNLSFLKIKSENLDLDKIKFRKMHFNHKI